MKKTESMLSDRTALMASVKKGLPSFGALAKNDLGSPAEALVKQAQEEAAAIDVSKQPPSPGIEGVTAGKAVISVSLEDLLESDANPRVSYDPQTVDSLAVSLAKDKLQTPILVTRVEGSYMIVEGHTRVKAAHSIGWTEIDAIVIDANNRRDRYLVGRATNTEREGLTQFDDGVAWGKLIQDGVFESYAALVRDLDLDLSKAEISRMKSYADLPAEIIAVMQNHKAKFTSSFAYLAKQVHDAHGLREGLDFVHDVISRDLSLKQAEHRKARICGEIEKTYRSPRKSLEITSNGKRVCEVKESQKGKIEIVLDEQAFPQDKRGEISDAIAELIRSKVEA